MTVNFNMRFSIQSGGNIVGNGASPINLLHIGLPNSGSNPFAGTTNFPGNSSLPAGAPVVPTVPVSPQSAEGDTRFLAQASPTDQQRYLKAAGGDQTIANTLARMATDPEGKIVLDEALAKGTTYQRGGLAGNTVGLTQSRTGRAPIITLEDPTSIDTVAHETAHAVFDDVNDPTPNDGVTHEDIYKFGHLVAQRLTGRALTDPYGFNGDLQNNAISRMLESRAA